MIILLNGCAASGKGTLGAMVADHFKVPHYDFGLIYRAIAAIASNFIEGTTLKDLELRDGHIFVRERDLTKALRSEEAGLRAALLAESNAGYLEQAARKFVNQSSFVADGRTISQIYPDADWHFHLTVDPYIAYQRRRSAGHYATFLERWIMDEKKIRPSPRAIHLDTSHQTVAQSLEEILSYVERG